MTSFPEHLRSLVPEIEAALDRHLPPADAVPVRLHEAMRYSIFAGGKRVRPGLVLLAGDAYGAAREDLLPAAAAMEMIHTFSLVHDDLPALDNDDLRRGRPTLHRQYDEALAVLAGDSLLNQGLLCVVREPKHVAGEIRSAAADMVASAVDAMILGQVLDLEAEAEWPAEPEAALERIHHLKTGALLTASLRLGGLYAGVDEAADRTLERIGVGVGLLFQIADDILDIEGDTAVLGKTAGKDAEARKLTYTELYGVEGARRRLAEVRDETLEQVAALPARQDLFIDLVRYLTERDR